MIKSLRKKFILVNMLLVSPVLLIVFSVLSIISYQMSQHGAERILEMALSRRDEQRPPMFEIGKTSPDDFMRELVFIVHVNQDGSFKLTSYGNVNVSEEKLSQVIAEAQMSGQNSGFLREYNLRYLKKHEPHGLRIAFMDVSNSNATLRNIVLSCILLFAASLAAFFFISLFLSRWALRPVEQAWRQQRQFVADASHELKTPLTVILANIGILKSNRADTIERQIGWVDNTEAEAKRMKKLVDSLLFLAKTDDSKTSVIHSDINFSDVIFGAALAFESVAYERGIAINTDCISPNVHVSGDNQQLSQLVGILLDNAVKYSNDDGVVTLSLMHEQDKAAFSVHNTGSLLTQEDLENVFDRFYRADKSRSNDGYGLGLAIAKSITENHNGKISVESNKEGSTNFTVTIPIYKPLTSPNRS